MNTLIKAANVTDVEPIWATLFAKALEGKDVKDMLLNVGSGGGAAAPAAGGASGGGAAAGGAAEEETKEEEKEEGQSTETEIIWLRYTDNDYREGRVRRGHGLRSLRLSAMPCDSHRSYIASHNRHIPSNAHSAPVVTDGWKRAITREGRSGTSAARLAKTDADYEACSETTSMAVFYKPRKLPHESSNFASFLLLCSQTLK